MRYDLLLTPEGVYDGREIARAMITDAYRFLAPYVDLDPDATDRLFSVIAREVIEQEHRQLTENGALERYMFTFFSEHDGGAGFEDYLRHLYATEEETARLLEQKPVVSSAKKLN